MHIHELEALGRAPATGDKLAIDTGEATAKLDYNVLADTVLSKVIRGFNSSTNIDNIKSTCLAYCSGATGTDVPAVGYGQLWVIGDSGLGESTRVTQIFVGAFNKDVWIRQYTGSPAAWSGWTKTLDAGKTPITAGGTGVNNISDLMNVVFSGAGSVTSYPTSAGIHHVGGTLFAGLPSTAGRYGLLIIMRNTSANYQIHLYLDSNNKLFFGFSYTSSGTNIVAPSSWGAISSAAVSPAT